MLVTILVDEHTDGPADGVIEAADPTGRDRLRHLLLSCVGLFLRADLIAWSDSSDEAGCNDQPRCPHRKLHYRSASAAGTVAHICLVQVKGSRFPSRIHASADFGTQTFSVKAIVRHDRSQVFAFMPR